MNLLMKCLKTWVRVSLMLKAELSQAKSAVRAGVKLITKAESDLVKATDKAQQKKLGRNQTLTTKLKGLEKAEQN